MSISSKLGMKGTSKERIDARSKAFQEKNNLSHQQMAMVDEITTIGLIVTRFQELFKIMPNSIKRPLAEVLFTIKQQLDAEYPISWGGTSIAGGCILCLPNKGAADCEHGPQMRAAFLLMAMLRVYPEPDLDTEEDEIDEEGLIPV